MFIITQHVYGRPRYQLIWYFRNHGSYCDFRDRGMLLTWKPLSEGFLVVKLKLLLRKFFGSPPWPKLLRNICVVFVVIKIRLFPRLLLKYSYSKSNLTGATSAAEAAYPSGATGFNQGFWCSQCCSIFNILFDII